jgi:SAM-dependent methyltransferase
MAIKQSVDTASHHDLVSPSCPVCESTRWSPIAEHPKVVFVRCSDCGTAYRRSHAVSRQLEQASGTAKSGGASEMYRRRSWRRIQKSRHQILDLLNHCEPGPLLDVGCSLGYPLLAARGLGLPATGVDVASSVVDHCRGLGFRAEVGTLEHLPFEDGEFSLIVLKHVLEHTPRPTLAIGELRRVLRPGGGIFVAVPYGGNRKARTDPQNHKFFAEKGQFGHYVYYEPQTLQSLLRTNGFRTVRVHPHLVHKRVSATVRLLQASVAPLRFIGQSVLNATRLRKEFWLW